MLLLLAIFFELIMVTNATIAFNNLLFSFFTAMECGLFLSDEDIKKGVWLEPGRALEYYLLRNGVR